MAALPAQNSVRASADHAIQPPARHSGLPGTQAAPKSVVAVSWQLARAPSSNNPTAPLPTDDMAFPSLVGRDLHRLTVARATHARMLACSQGRSR